jgi:hypothetical protein
MGGAIRSGAGTTAGAARSGVATGPLPDEATTPAPGGTAAVDATTWLALGTGTATGAGGGLEFRASGGNVARSSIGAGRWLRKPSAASASRQRSRHASLRVGARRGDSA